MLLDRCIVIANTVDAVAEDEDEEVDVDDDDDERRVGF